MSVRRIQFLALALALLGVTVLLGGRTVHAQPGFPSVPSFGVPQFHLLGCANGAPTITLPEQFPGQIPGIGTIVTPNFPPALDNALRTDCVEIRKKFQVDAPVFFVMESVSPNACAVRECVVPGTQDGTIFFGQQLLLSEFQSNQGHGVPAILAHEFAHVMQSKRGFNDAGMTMYRELHADFMAGWFIAHRARFLPQVPMAAWMSVFSKGDFAFNTPQHHGTPQQRGACFSAGFNLNISGNVSDAGVAFGQGIAFLKSQGAALP